MALKQVKPAVRPAAGAGTRMVRVLPPGGRRRRRGLPLLPRTMDRYVGMVFLNAYFICAVSFCGLYIMVEALVKLDRFLGLPEPLWVSLPQYFAAMVPTVYVNYLGPILTTAAAVATAIALQRANELSPLKACGVSVHRALLPIFALGALLAGVNYYLQESLIPNLRAPIRHAISLTRRTAIKPDPFFDQLGNQLIKIREYSPANQFGRGIEVSRVFPNGRPREKIDAQELIWQPDPGSDRGPDRGHWILHHGSIQRWSEGGDLVQNPAASDFARLKEPFQKRRLEGGLLPIDLETSDQDIAYLSWRELKAQLKRQPDQRHLEVKLHHHLAFPLAHLVLPALTIPLILASGTRSVLLSVGAGVVICASFYLLSSLAMNTAAQADHFSPLLGAWLPMLLFGALGVTLMAEMRS